MAVITFMRRTLLPGLALIFALITAFSGGFLSRPYLERTAEADYPILDEAISILKENGLKEMPAQQVLEYGMIHGAVQAYGDPYTVFVEPVQNELQSNELEGKFGGIGVRMQRDAEGNMLLYPYPDSPAGKVGIQDGDRLLQVEDLLVTPQVDPSSIEAAIRGPVGQQVRITYAHPPEFTPFEVSIKRAEVPLPSVSWNLAPGEPRIGWMQINIIAATTPGEIEKAVEDLQQQKAGYFILDLRNNGGGLLDAGVDTARLFLEEGIVIEEQFHDRVEQEFRVEKSGPLADIPLVTVVNQNTASAAEIIAGALLEHGRTPLIGTPTFGKDTIQLVFNLKDESSLHVTAGRWWFPGKDAGLEGHGIQPTIAVADDPNNPSGFIEAARQWLNLE